MAKLYFKYGAMGSSKTAQALITNFNYKEKGRRPLLLKPSADKRDGENILRSRIGISEQAFVIHPDDNILQLYLEDILNGKYSVIITDESQFFTPEQIDQLRRIVDFYNIPVICYGLRTDFQTHFFPGSLRLMEVADSISEIKTICLCGKKAIFNARVSFDENQNIKIITAGNQIELGGNEKYISLCSECYHGLLNKAQQESE